MSSTLGPCALKVNEFTVKSEGAAAAFTAFVEWQLSERFGPWVSDR